MYASKRNQYLINKKIQFGLIRRMLAYWCLTWILVFSIPVAFNFVISVTTTTDRPSTGAFAIEMVNVLFFPIMISLVFLPIAAWDSIRFSNRFAGPVFRIRRAIQELADNKEGVAKINLRKKDYCTELADEINRMMDTIADLKSNRQDVDNCKKAQELESVG